ncbi:MAG: hypothetical protein MUC97_11965 [Bernardetiaceae bacterium]|nr:hypothetical protein [Bernardetiaceae bacterium]
MRLLRWLLFLPWLALGACQNSSPDPEGQVELRLQLQVGGSPLNFNTARYQNAAGNSFTITDFRMYVSQVKLRNRATGQVYAEPESYHLVRRGDTEASYVLTLAGVPAGQYDELEFSIGVDPPRNKSTDQVGDLDPTNLMAWDWNTGYKFVLLEGRFFATEANPRGLVYHIGSDENYRTVRLPLGQGVQVTGGAASRIELVTNVLAMFNGPNRIDFAQHVNVMGGPVATQVADNYAQGMFAVRN